MNKNKEILKWSNPKTVRRKAKSYLGKNAQIFLSSKNDKKYMVFTPNGKVVHFGAFGMEDYTKHHNSTRRRNYLNRSAGIKGNWKKNKYSANNLSRNLLW
jgi:hypothetical protein